MNYETSVISANDTLSFDPTAKRGKTPWIIAAVVIILAIAAGAYYFMSKSSSGAAAATSAARSGSAATGAQPPAAEGSNTNVPLTTTPNRGATRGRP